MSLCNGRRSEVGYGNKDDKASGPRVGADKSPVGRIIDMHSQQRLALTQSYVVTRPRGPAGQRSRVAASNPTASFPDSSHTNNGCYAECKFTDLTLSTEHWALRTPCKGVISAGCLAPSVFCPIWPRFLNGICDSVTARDALNA